MLQSGGRYLRLTDGLLAEVGHQIQEALTLVPRTSNLGGRRLSYLGSVHPESSPSCRAKYSAMLLATYPPLVDVLC
jgi:hypothetical protein